MYFKQFIRKLSEDATGNKIVEQLRSYSQLIEKTDCDKILINGSLTEFKNIEEARYHIKQEYSAQQLETETLKDLYEDLSPNVVATIIKEHHDVKVTDTLIENYINLASSNVFTIDPVVQQIRKLNKLDGLLENKLHYVLNDECIVAINESTQEFLNNLLQDEKDIIEYMRESKENFFYVLNQIEE